MLKRQLLTEDFCFQQERNEVFAWVLNVIIDVVREVFIEFLELAHALFRALFTNTTENKVDPPAELVTIFNWQTKHARNNHYWNVL